MRRALVLGAVLIGLVVSSVAMPPAPAVEAQQFDGRLRPGLYSVYVLNSNGRQNWLIRRHTSDGTSYVFARLPGDLIFYGLTVHDGYLHTYAHISGTGGGVFRLGQEGPELALTPGTSLAYTRVKGLASDGSTIYLSVSSTPYYSSVKRGIHSLAADGTLTEVLAISESALSPGRITWHDGAIWGADSDEVYRVDPADSSLTRYTWEALGITGSGSLLGMASYDGRLYVNLGSSIWDVTDTAGATQVSSSTSHVGLMAGYDATEDLPTQGFYLVDSLDRLLWADVDSGSAVIPVTQIHAPALTERYSLDVKGITIMNGVMYILDQTTPALYTVDRSSGAATRVGTATDFGVSETQPAGLTSRDGELYMLGGDNGALLRLSAITGEAVVASGLGSSETSPIGLAALAGSFYMVGVDSDLLHIIDEDTGLAYPVGDSGGFGVAEHQPTGLTVIDGELFVVGQDTDQLHQISRFTGKAANGRSSLDFEFDALAYSTYYADVQPSGVTAVAAAPTPVADDDPPDISFIPGQQVALSRDERVALGVVNFGLVASSVDAQDIASHNGVLYLLETSSRAVYRMEHDTGRATGGVALTGFNPGNLVPFQSDLVG